MAGFPSRDAPARRFAPAVRRRPAIRLAAPEAGLVVRFQQPEPPPLERIAPYYRLAEEARWYSNGGPCATLLAERLAAYLGEQAPGPACLPVANCTLGLLVALRAAFGEPGARRLVPTPSFTFAATAAAVVWAGFEPLFVDVDPLAWQLDPDALEAALDAHAGEVAGVLACSTFGSAPPAAARARWRAACAAHGVPLLLDSAAGFGSRDEHGRRIGALGEAEVFSFHATKPFAVGEAGAVVSRDADVVERAAALANFGFDVDRRVAAAPGLNAKLSELQAATALAMLDAYPDALARRRASAQRLAEAVAHLPLELQRGSSGSTWQVFQTLAPSAAARRAVVEEAERLGVEVRTYFDPPLHRHPGFGRHPVGGPLETTERVAARALSLPLANDLLDWQVERIVAVVERALERAC